MFSLGGGDGLEALQSAFDVAGHGHIADAIFAVPLERESAVLRASPIKADVIRLFERGNQMVGVGAAHVANADVV